MSHAAKGKGFHCFCTASALSNLPLNSMYLTHTHCSPKFFYFSLNLYINIFTQTFELFSEFQVPFSHLAFSPSGSISVSAFLYFTFLAPFTPMTNSKRRIMAPRRGPLSGTGNTQTQGHKRMQSLPDASNLPPNKTLRATEAENNASSRVRGASAPRGHIVRRRQHDSQHPESGSSAVVSHLGDFYARQSDASQVRETPRGEEAATRSGGTIADSDSSFRQDNVTGDAAGTPQLWVESPSSQGRPPTS